MSGVYWSSLGCFLPVLLYQHTGKKTTTPPPPLYDCLEEFYLFFFSSPFSLILSSVCPCFIISCLFVYSCKWLQNLKTVITHLVQTDQNLTFFFQVAFKTFFLFSSFSFHCLQLSLLHLSFFLLHSLLLSVLLSWAMILSPILFHFIYYPISLLFSPSQTSQQHTGRRQSCSLPPFPYQCVFIVQGEVGDLLNTGMLHAVSAPQPPHTALHSCSSSSFLVYLHSPSLSHFKAPWGGLGGEWWEEGLSGVTIITWLASNSWALLPVLPKAYNVLVQSWPFFIAILQNTVWYFKEDVIVALTPSGETEASRKRRLSWVELICSGCFVCRGHEVLGVRDRAWGWQEGGVVGEVFKNIFLSLCFATFTVFLKAPN